MKRLAAGVVLALLVVAGATPARAQTDLRWSPGPPMPTPRSSPAVTPWGSTLGLSELQWVFVAGGADQQGRPLTVKEGYLLNTNEWVTFDPPMLVPRAGATAAIVAGGPRVFGGCRCRPPAPGSGSCRSMGSCTPSAGATPTVSCRMRRRWTR